MRHITSQMRSATLDGYLDLVKSLGRNPYTFIHAVGLQAKFLEDPEALIPRDAGRELLEITARATQAEDLALRLAAQRKLSALGPISLVLREEPSPRAALNTLCRYLKLVNTSLIINVEDAGSTVIIREDLLPSPGLEMRQSVELAVGTLFQMLKDLIGSHWRPLEVRFAHRAPIDDSKHKEFFGRNVKFNQEFNGLICLAKDLSNPREPGDQVSANFARKHLEAALKVHCESVRETCRQLIFALLPSGSCTAQVVAQHLRVDRRTLHRRLYAEKITFKEILDEVRIDLVKRHLRESDLPLNEVAELLGFSGPSSFSHWFHNNFGCSASQWIQLNYPESIRLNRIKFNILKIN